MPRAAIAPEAAPQERYQFKPFPGSSHVWALGELAGLPTSARVLDIGPGSGAIGLELRERGLSALDAVEIDPRAREHVTPIYRRVEETVRPLAGNKYDVILLLDVLEHLADPASFLDDAAVLLAPGGAVLLSVPNVAHWSVRLSLLAGRFEYTERGILDKTHLHFFTGRHLDRMLEARCGLRITERNGSISPVQFLLPEGAARSGAFALFSRLRQGAARLAPGLCAYQHLRRVERPAAGG